MTSVSTTNSSAYQATIMQRRQAAMSGQPEESAAPSGPPPKGAAPTDSTEEGSLTESSALNPSMMAYLFNLNETGSSESSESIDSDTESASTLTSVADNIFSAIDADGDGVISQTEFEEAESDSGLSSSEIETLYSELDTSGTGITQSQFEEAVTEAVTSAPPPPPPMMGRMEESDSTTDTELSALLDTIGDDIDQLTEDLTALSSSRDASATTETDTELSSLVEGLKTDFDKLVSDLGLDSGSVAATSTEAASADGATAETVASAINTDLAALLKALNSYLSSAAKTAGTVAFSSLA